MGYHSFSLHDAFPIFCTLSWSAARTKSPTTDEPMHALAAWLWTHERDFRLDPEDPPLWGYWMSLPNSRDRSGEHTSELQSPCNLVCRLLLEKKKKERS